MTKTVWLLVRTVHGVNPAAFNQTNTENVASRISLEGSIGSHSLNDNTHTGNWGVDLMGEIKLIMCFNCLFSVNLRMRTPPLCLVMCLLILHLLFVGWIRVTEVRDYLDFQRRCWEIPLSRLHPLTPRAKGALQGCWHLAYWVLLEILWAGCLCQSSHDSGLSHWVTIK